MAWRPQGPQEAVISRLARPTMLRRGRPPGAGGYSVCACPRLIISFCWAPHCQNTECCLQPPCPINHLFIQFEDYSCSFATSSPTCHGVSRGRHPQAVLKPSHSFSMATNWGGWKPHWSTLTSWMRTPTQAPPCTGAAGVGVGCSLH